MRNPNKSLLSTTLLLLIAVTAQAQTGSTEANASGTASPASELQAADRGAVANPNLTANASVRSRSKAERFEAIKEKGARVAPAKLSKVESRLKDASNRVQDEVEATAGTIIANRLAGEFNTTTEALVKQEARNVCGWGNLVIAYTLASNSRGEVTADELIELHLQHVRWAQIAAGLGYRLDDVVSAVKIESRVALGTAQADGRVAGVRPGADAGVAAGGSGVGAGIGVSADASVPKVKVGD